MSVLRNLESKIADLVEGTFGRVFRSEVRPAELARGLAKEMDQHRTVSVSRTYVPNEYVVWLSPDDRGATTTSSTRSPTSSAAYLLEHARREQLALVSAPEVDVQHRRRACNLGEFGIQARMVRAVAATAGRTPSKATTATRWSTRPPTGSGTSSTSRAGRSRPAGRWSLAEGKRLVVAPAGAVIGRSRDCDVVLADPNVSRHHAELRPRPRRLACADLGSTNGVKVNGRRIRAPTPLEPGDRSRSAPPTSGSSWSSAQ